MYDQFRKAVSDKRLQNFRRTNDSERDQLARYIWNTEICESFYPILHFLEIGLRNSLHDSITHVKRGDASWFNLPFICEKNAARVEDAIAAIKEKGKDHTDPNRIVAELNFGFWTRLFNTHYQKELWNDKAFLIRAFPYAKSTERSRGTLALRMDQIRRFRNRIFHHNYVLSEKLQGMYRDITEVMDWINPSLSQVTAHFHRFPTISRAAHYEELKETCKALIPDIEPAP